MKKLTLIAAVVALAGLVSAQGLITDPGFTDLSGSPAVGGTGSWLGYEGTVWAENVPGGWVTSSAGVATVTPYSGNELSFYQEFLSLAAGSYTFTIDASAITADGGPLAFVKEFDGGYGWIGFAGTDPLVNGSTATINFTVTAGNIYQVGTSTTGATSGSYSLSNPSLIPEPATIGLLGIAGLGLFITRRRRI